MINDYIQIIKDIFIGMFKQKEVYKRIEKRPVNERPLIANMIILMIFSAISILYIRSKALSYQGNLPDFILDRIDNYNTIVTMHPVQLLLQVFYTLVISFLASSVYIKIAAWIGKAKVTFRECCVLASYSWGPNVIASAIMTLLVLIMPIEKTMFAQSIFDIIITNPTAKEFFTILDPFYIYSIFIIFKYTGYIPAKNGRRYWHIWILIIFLFPILTGIVSKAAG